MPYVKLFGGAVIEGQHGPLAGPAAQRRRLALLALLVTHRSGTLTRDKIIGYLWPESDTDRARHLLSESLYVLRKALGEGALSSVGDDLRLNTQEVSSDVQRFAEALHSGDYARATSLYAGPFLDGFHLANAPEFEHWADGEREGLARAFAVALEALAKQQAEAGDLVGAVESWRRLAAHDPFDSRVALGVMQALEVVGNRAAAIQHARVHEALLRDEFGAEPDSRIVAMVERLRTAPTATGSSAPDADNSIEPQAAPSVAAEPRAPEPPSPTAPPPQVPPTLAPVAATGLDQDRRVPHAVERVSAHAGRRPWFHVRYLIGTSALVGAVVLAVAVPEPWNVLTFRNAAADIVETGSIAVLPFANTSPDGENEYFSDGLTEELISALSRIDGLRVPSRQSSFVFKNRPDVDLREIGRRLAVAHVLEGSVKKVETRLRISVHLIQVSDDKHLWSATYDRELDDLFAVQEDIARAIVTTLRIHLAGGPDAPLVHRPTTDVEAWNLYLMGRYFWNKRDGSGLGKGMEFFQLAIERDSSFALPYAGIADTYILLTGFGPLAPTAAYPPAKEAAEHALTLDPSRAETHTSLAQIRLYYDRDWTAAQRQFLRAIELNPRYPTARQWYALFHAWRGDTREAMAEIRRAQELDPLSIPIQTSVGTILYYARRYDEAIEQYLKTLEMEPHFWVARVQLGIAYLKSKRDVEAIDELERAAQISGGDPFAASALGVAYAQLGRHADAREILRQLDARAAQRYISPAYLAAITLAMGEREQALQWLERGAEARDDWMIFLGVEPLFDPLRSDPRFVELLRRIGFTRHAA